MNENATTNGPITPTTTTIPDYKCDQCEKVFAKAAGLRMHKIRKHGRGWSTGGNFASKSREERLTTRRAYQRRLRERYYREGKNSKGEPMPAGWRPRMRKAVALARAKAKAKPPSRGREYQRAYARKHYAKLKALRNGLGVQPAQSDQLGDAAKAILLAAKVLRGTVTALKLP